MKNNFRLYVVEPNGSGGLIHFSYQLCTALADQGVDVTLVTGSEYELAHMPHNFKVENFLDLWTIFDPQSMKGPIQNPWIRLLGKVRWAFRRGFRAIRLVRAWIRLTVYLSDQKPDLIQFSRIDFPFESLFLSWLRSRGLCLTQVCHEFELREDRGLFSGVNALLYRRVYAQFTTIFFLANQSRDRFLSIFPSIHREKTQVIPHGNSAWLLNFHPSNQNSETLRDRFDLGEGEQVVLFFGLLAPSKGIEDLVDAFALVQKANRAKLVIAGYPTKYFEIGKLQSRMNTLGVDDDVILDTRYIPLEEIGPLMQLASVVVYPYRSSTQSGSLQVAYTFGRPVIATSVGGLPEVVEDGKSGFLVPVGSPPALAEKITLLLDNPGLASRMGKYARFLSETRFSWHTVASQVIEVYNQLLLTG